MNWAKPCSNRTAIVALGAVLTLVGMAIYGDSKAVLVAGEAETPLADPVFGLEFRPSKVGYDPAPTAVYKCAELASRRGHMFLFGKTRIRQIQFYLISGWVEVRSEGESPHGGHLEAESDEGIIAILSPQGCRVIGAGYAWSSSDRFRNIARGEYGVTDDVVSALLRDAVSRAIHAYGSKDAFLCRLAASDVDRSTLPDGLEALVANLGQPQKRCPASANR